LGGDGEDSPAMAAGEEEGARVRITLPTKQISTDKNPRDALLGFAAVYLGRSFAPTDTGVPPVLTSR
jgi:hypothetical protein